MAPAPKPPGQRVRRNIDQGRWKTLPAAKPFERPPPLPPRRSPADVDRDLVGAEVGRLEKLSRAELNDLAAQREIEGAKSLPSKKAVAKAIREAYAGWLPSTLQWWGLLWESPMGAMWIESDIPALVELARFKDFEDRGQTLPGPQQTRKTHLEDRLGLSPKARRQLQWEIARAEADAPGHEARTRTRPRAVDRQEARAVARR